MPRLSAVLFCWFAVLCLGGCAGLDWKTLSVRPKPEADAVAQAAQEDAKQAQEPEADSPQLVPVARPQTEMLQPYAVPQIVFEPPCPNDLSIYDTQLQVPGSPPPYVQMSVAQYAKIYGGWDEAMKAVEADLALSRKRLAWRVANRPIADLKARGQADAEIGAWADRVLTAQAMRAAIQCNLG